MDNIFVTKPFLPPLEEYNDYLKKIWERKWITNGGELHQQLEKELAEYLGVKYISLFSNGTIALITALQALEIKGEVITTPYSFVATANSLMWNGSKPVFADVDLDSCNLSIEKIEAAITPNTTALMPVHVYGNTCKVLEIENLAKKYNLKVIYDGAHAFNVKKAGQSVLNFGDLTILSFHATKVFSTIEGGAIVSHTLEMKKKIDDLKNFGIVNEETVVAAGINGKMNEFQAAFGLLCLKYVDENILKRKQVCDEYSLQLKNIPGVRLFNWDDSQVSNYGYYPIFIDKNKYGKSRDELYNAMKEVGVFGRRYFYPLISEFSIYADLPSASTENLPNAKLLSDQVICLPLYPELSKEEITAVINSIRNNFSEKG